MSTSVRQVSAEESAAFNGQFSTRPHLEQQLGLAVFKTLLIGCDKSGRRISPLNLAEGVNEAFERRKKQRDVNLVAYALSVADRLEQRAASQASEGAHESRKRESLAPIGIPTINVAGAKIPAPEMPEHWAREVGAAITESGLTGQKAQEVRTVMLMVSRGWRDTPTAAIRSIAQGLCGEPGNGFAYAVREIEALEAVGVVCAAPERDPFIREVEEYISHRHDVTPKMRAAFMDAVHLLLDAPWFVGERKVDLRRLGPAIVTSTWGWWVQKVMDSVTRKEPIPNPYRYLLRKATRLALEQEGVNAPEEKEEHPAYS